jgi:hypothetical protein
LSGILRRPASWTWAAGQEFIWNNCNALVWKSSALKTPPPPPWLGFVCGGLPTPPRRRPARPHSPRPDRRA